MNLHSAQCEQWPCLRHLYWYLLRLFFTFLLFTYRLYFTSNITLCILLTFWNGADAGLLNN